jgi:hypothetical protein
MRRDHEFNEPVVVDGVVQTFKGWRDPNFKPDPAATPVPACHSGTSGTPPPAPSLGTDTTVLELSAVAPVSYDKLELTAPADEVFAIHFNNTETGIEHDVDLRDSAGTTLQDQAKIVGPAEATYVYDALDAGTYTFICSVHPIPQMTGTLTVE